MGEFLKDGLSLLAELSDKACLRSNVLTGPVLGRNAVGQILTKLEAVYSALIDLERTHTPAREIILSRATLPSGLKITITTVGSRDREGWIAEIFMNHEPAKGAAEVRTLLLE